MNSVETYMEKQPVKYFLCIAGALVYSFGMNIFIVPMGLYSGGIMGISQILETLIKSVIPGGMGNFSITGVLYLVLNVPFFILAFRSIGRRFLIKTGINVVCITAFMSIIPVLQVPVVDDVLTGAIIGGIICGVGAGITLQSGGSGAGLEILGVYLAKRGSGLSVGRLSIIINAGIYGICLLMFDVRVTIYSIIFAVFSSVIVDRVHTQSINVETMIFTKTDGTAIRDIMVNEFGRSATLWTGTGGYTQENTVIVYAVLSKYEARILRRMIREKDPHAFMVLNVGCHITGNFPKHL